jgi:transposase-like protein
MSENRKRYEPEFRDDAVRIVEESGKPIAQIARDLGVNEGSPSGVGLPQTAGPVLWAFERGA